MKVSFNILNGQSPKEKEEILAAMRKVLESGHYVLGPEVKRFEADFAAYNGSKYAVGVANGLEALQIALMALGIGPGDEVITAPLSAVATALAVRAVGANVVFVDIDDFYHLDAGKLEKAVTPKTRAIIPIHLYGQAADMDAIMKIASARKIHVVEDCAQAHGTSYDGKKVGSFGIFGAFSFYPTKNLGGIGDGGLITTDDKTLAEKCSMLRNYGQSVRYYHTMYGINSRLDELQAAILSEQLKHLDTRNARRMEIAEIYFKKLSGIKEISLPTPRENSNHIYHLFVIKTDSREALQKFLKEKEVETLIHYPVPLHKQECFPEFNNLKLQNVEEKSDQILSLPIHPYMKDEEVNFVCEKIIEFFSKNL